MIIYDRTKYDKQARVFIINKAAEIIERYRNEAYMTMYSRLSSSVIRLNKTLWTSEADKR